MKVHGEDCCWKGCSKWAQCTSRQEARKGLARTTPAGVLNRIGRCSLPASICEQAVHNLARHGTRRLAEEDAHGMQSPGVFHADCLKAHVLSPHQHAAVKSDHGCESLGADSHPRVPDFHVVTFHGFGLAGDEVVDPEANVSNQRYHADEQDQEQVPIHAHFDEGIVVRQQRSQGAICEMEGPGILGPGRRNCCHHHCILHASIQPVVCFLPGVAFPIFFRQIHALIITLCSKYDCTKSGTLAPCHQTFDFRFAVP
jgi:hypothetical protein